MGKCGPVVTIKSGAIKIPIHYIPSKNCYRAWWLENGKRPEMQSADLNKLKAKVRKVAQRLSKAVVEINTLSEEQSLIVAEVLRRGLTLSDLDRIQGRPDPIALGDAIDEFLKAVAADVSDSERNERTLRGHCRSFQKAIGGNKFIGQILPKQIDKWIRSGSVSGKTQHNRRRSVITLFRWCRKKDMLDSEYLTAAEKTDTPKIKKAGRVAIWTPTELRKMLENCRADYLPWLVISCFAGVRTNELNPVIRRGIGKDPLRWEDIKLDWDTPHIEVRPETSKTGDRRLIPISPTLLAWLEPLHKGEGRISPTKAPSKRNRNIPSITDELAQAAGVKQWKPNANRHSFGSYRTALTKNLGEVALEMGNSPATIKQHYLEAVQTCEGEEFFALTPERIKRSLRVVA